MRRLAWFSLSLAVTASACGSKKDRRAAASESAPAGPAAPAALPTGPIVEPGGAPPPTLDLAKGARAVLGGTGPRHATDGHMIAFSPDGRRLATIDREGLVFVWDVASGAPIERIHVKAYRSFVGFRGDVLSLSAPEQFVMAPVSDDGGWLYTESERGGELFEIATGTVTPFALKNPFALSARGTTVALIAEDRTVTVGPVTGPRVTIASPDEQAYSALLSPDAKHVAVFLENKTIRVHPVAGGAPRVLSLDSLLESSDGATRAAWSPDGNWLAVVVYGNVLGLVDVTRGVYSELARDAFANELIQVAWSPNGRAIAAVTKYGRVRLWDARTGTLVHAHDGVIGTAWDVAVTPDGSLVAAAGGEHAHLWKLAGGASAPQTSLGDHEHWVTHVALSADGTVMASCSDYGDINVRDTGTGKLLGKLDIQSSDCEALALRGQRLLAFDGTKLHVFELRGNLKPRPIPLAAGRKYGSATFAASLDGAFVAAGGDDGQVAVHAVSGALVWKFTMPDDPDEDGQRYESHALAFDPSGKWLASAGDDLVRIHDARTGRVTRTIALDRTTAGWPTSIAWSGSRVIIGRSTGEIQAFDRAGKRVLDVRHRLGGVFSLAATASQIYAGGEDGAITIWDLP